MSAVYTKRKHILNINASVDAAINYLLRRHGNLTAWDVQAVINNTVEDEDDQVTLEQVRKRLSSHIGQRYALQRAPHSAYYYPTRRLGIPVKGQDRRFPSA